MSTTSRNLFPSHPAYPSITKPPACFLLVPKEMAYLDPQGVVRFIAGVRKPTVPRPFQIPTTPTGLNPFHFLILTFFSPGGTT